MFCRHCGVEVPANSAVCPSCGKAIGETLADIVPDPTQPEQPAQSTQVEETIVAQQVAQPNTQTPPQAGVQTGNQVGAQTGAQQTIDYNTLSKEQYKDAKAAYKAARRASGKSHTPLVVTIIILVLLLVVGAAGAVWFVYNPQVTDLTNENKELKAQVEKLTAENEELTTKLAAYESGVQSALESDKTNPLLGSWKVSAFESTSEHYACYGGKAKQASVRMNITSIDSLQGTIVADISVVYHGHDRTKLKADIDSSSDDVVLDFSGVTGQYADGAFTFELPVDSKYGSTSGIVVTGLMSTSGTSSTFRIAVASYYQSLTNAITDTYTMKN